MKCKAHSEQPCDLACNITGTFFFLQARQHRNSQAHLDESEDEPFYVISQPLFPRFIRQQVPSCCCTWAGLKGFRTIARRVFIRAGSGAVVCNTGGGATTTGPDATYPPAICQNSGGGGGGGGGQLGRVQPGVGGGSCRGSGGGCSCRGSGGGLAGGQGGRPARGEGGGVRVRVRVKVRVRVSPRVRVTELVEPVLVL